MRGLAEAGIKSYLESGMGADEGQVLIADEQKLSLPVKTFINGGPQYRS